MTNAVGRAAAAALLAGLLGAAWVALFYAWHSALRVEFDRDLPRNVAGIYPPERDPATALTFAWTGADAVIRLPGLDRGATWSLDLRMRGGRPGAANPDVTILADGIAIATAQSSLDWIDVHVVIPSRADRRGLTLGLRPSTTFVPGPGDPRPLGVVLDRLTLTPERTVLVPRPALVAASVSAAAMGGAIALLGVTAGSAIGGAVLLSAGAASVIARGFGPFTNYPDVVIRLGVGIALALAVGSLTLQYWRGKPLRNTARFAAAFSAAALLLKLLVLLHPNMAIGDAMFQAHRFQGVLAGNLYFTSIAPGGYAFPYPPGLYVFAAAFAGMVRRGAADVTLLRTLTTSVDAVAGLLLYRIVDSAWRNRLAAAISVAIYHLIPVELGVLTTGNLTNAFAQSVAVGALGLMTAAAVARRRWRVCAALAIVLTIAYLSHTGTLAILFVATIASAALFAIRGGADGRRAAAVIFVATVAAAVVSVGIYYAHFIETYRSEFARIGHETATAASDAGGRTVGDRLRLVPYSLGIYIGAPVLLFAFLGTTEMMRRASPDRLAIVLGGWTASCVLFLVVGVLTPVDMRYYLAAVPVLAIAAAYGAAWAWNEAWPLNRTMWRAAAAVFLAAAISTGFHNWWNALG
ncbi:MAG TPA: hypothetical protein VEL51_01315 [Vicinamibacterales bacterium]|nr:hypothetical protein [Vicinamibacterales bacterium]